MFPFLWTYSFVIFLSSGPGSWDAQLLLPQDVHLTFQVPLLASCTSLAIPTIACSRWGQRPQGRLGHGGQY